MIFLAKGYSMLTNQQSYKFEVFKNQIDDYEKLIEKCPNIKKGIYVPTWFLPS